jgi:hypothetical protein
VISLTAETQSNPNNGTQIGRPEIPDMNVDLDQLKNALDKQLKDVEQRKVALLKHLEQLEGIRKLAQGNVEKNWPDREKKL